MASVKGIDHLVIRVSDFARSKTFYNQVLGFLDFELAEEYEGAAGWANGKTLFWIGQADAKGDRLRGARRRVGSLRRRSHDQGVPRRGLDPHGGGQARQAARRR